MNAASRWPVTLTVTYYPEPELLLCQLRALPAACRKLVVDNGTAAAHWAAVDAQLGGVPNLECLRLGRNLGLAAAINHGMRHLADASGDTLVLWLDQDSEPTADALQRLVEAHDGLLASGAPVGAVGPVLVDAVTGLAHGFHCIHGWRWRRVHPAPGTRPLPCASLNGSGTMLRLSVWRALGGLDEALFIDHVDTEWSFRLRAAGYGLWGVPDAVFRHRMGVCSRRLWLVGLWPWRTSARHYYLFRNAVVLMRRPRVPRVWKCWAAVKLLLTAVVHGIYDRERARQWRAMLRGVRDGLRFGGGR